MRVGGHLALSLHSSNEPGEVFQWLVMIIATYMLLLLLLHLHATKMLNTFCINFLIHKTTSYQTQNVKHSWELPLSFPLLLLLLLLLKMMSLKCH